MSYALSSEAIERVPIDSTSVACKAADRVEPTAYLSWKGVLGRTVALALLAAGTPVILLTMLVVRLTSRGPAIFRQTRVGRHGRVFVMYKIRTMRLDAEAATGPVWTQQNDPRITRMGRWIRRLHIDEFPQLINVIKGEMALIGPRPERPEFTQKLAVAIPTYLDRLAVRPGVTGLAQINLPPDTDLESVRRKLILDLVYIREGSLWLDVRIFACTFARLFAIKGPRITRLFGLERIARLPSSHPTPDSEPMVTDDESLNLVAANMIPKKNGHAIPAQNSNQNGRWSHEVPSTRVRHPR
jgi:lipopolysaccharide/colanic/teichoic acid biosynthesis glycosyltransferase